MESWDEGGGALRRGGRGWGREELAEVEPRDEVCGQVVGGARSGVEGRGETGLLVVRGCERELVGLCGWFASGEDGSWD